jgi:hypothetical protein
MPFTLFIWLLQPCFKGQQICETGGMQTKLQDPASPPPPTPETEAASNERPGIWRKWHHLIVLGCFVVIYMIGFKFWATYQADLPIVDVYRSYLDYLDSRSPKAQAYEATYFREKGRDTIASRHFEHLCAVMTALAIEDGYLPTDYTDIPAPWCYERSVHYSEFLQPQ